LSGEEIQQDMNRELVGDEAGLAAYYRMSDGAGLVLTDDSLNDWNGTLKDGSSTVPGDGFPPAWVISGAFGSTDPTPTPTPTEEPTPTPTEEPTPTTDGERQRRRRRKNRHRRRRRTDADADGRADPDADGRTNADADGRTDADADADRRTDPDADADGRTTPADASSCLGCRLCLSV
jgi:hypothetical protein